MLIRRALAWLSCYALAVGAFLLLTGCATLQDRAEGAAAADGATSIGALALGAAEANPLGLLTIPAKIGMLAYCKTLPEDERAECHSVAGAMWSGAAVNNLCVIVALLTSGAIAPACLLGGIGYGVFAWNESAAERSFYTACAEYRRVSGEAVRCVYRIEG